MFKKTALFPRDGFPKTPTRICAQTIRTEEDGCGVGLCIQYGKKDEVGRRGVDRGVATAVVQQDSSVSIGDRDVVVLACRLPFHGEVGELKSQDHVACYLDGLTFFQVVWIVEVWVVWRGHITCSCQYKNLNHQSKTFTIGATRLCRAKWGIFGCSPDTRPSDRVRCASDRISVTSAAAAVDHQGGQLSSTSAPIVMANLSKSKNIVYFIFIKSYMHFTHYSTNKTWVLAGETQGWPSAGGSWGHSRIHHMNSTQKIGIFQEYFLN